MEKERSLADIMEEEENKEKAETPAETKEEIKEEVKEEVEETSEDKKEEKDKEEKIDVKKMGQDEKIGDLGLTKRELESDMTTPAQNMSNLKKFAEELDLEAEKLKEKYGKQKEEAKTKKEIEEMMNEKTDFDDEIIDDDEEEQVEEKETKKVVDSEPAEKTTDEKKKIVLKDVKIRKIKDKSKRDNFFNELIIKRRKRQKTTRVPLICSGYIADMSPLSSPEIRDLSNALRTKDAYGYWEFLYKIIHEKIASTSIGAMDFETFLKSTSLNELEILLYGIFCSSYPDKNSFPAKCPNSKCGLEFNFEYANDDYMVFDDMDEDGNSKIKDKMRELVAAQAIDAKKFFKESLTNTLYRVPLSDSGYIVELRHPTLYNQLHDVIKQMVEQQLEDASEVTLNRLPFIEKVLVPYDEENPEYGYIEYDEMDKKIALLSALTEDDDVELEEAISDKILSTSHISFRMHDVTCRVCGAKLMDEDVDFRSLLFMIHRIRSVKKK